MFIPSLSYSTIETSFGVKLSFKEVSPVSSKLADINSASRSNRISNITLSSVARPLASGESFEIKKSDIVNSNIPNIDDSYLGVFKPSSFTFNNQEGSITFYQESSADINTIDVIGDLYSVPNISPRSTYLIQFVVESFTPDSAQVTLSPSSYVIGGSEAFVPTTVVQMRSLYSKSAKALIKMLIKDIATYKVLKTEYIEVVMSDAGTAPCEIISEEPVGQAFIYLEKDNNWIYDYQGYRIAEFVPNNSDTIVKLPKKNDRLLPNRLDSSRVKITVDPIQSTNYGITIDQIRTAILNQYATIQNSFALANLGNKSYDIVVKDVLLKPEDLNDLVVGKMPPVTGTNIKFNQVARAEPYQPDISNIPEINLLRANNSGILYLGEIHFDNTIYLDSSIIVDYNGISFSGTLRQASQGPNYLTAIQ